MRTFVAVILVVYLVGIGVALAPAIRANWNSVPASELASIVTRALPNAFAWPARAYRSMSA